MEDIAMPTVKTGDIDTYYEIHGNGSPIVFVHGAWVDYQMWRPQIEYFSKDYKVIVYDVRGHGKTGGSSKKKYTIELFADDLERLITTLKINHPIICGLSMGGMIAQRYAVNRADDLLALILSDTALSTTLTLMDKITRYILAPKWMFLGFVRLMGVKRYANFANWFAKKSRGENWMKDKDFIEYEKEQMMSFTVKEFNKIFSAIYDFKLQDLSRIQVPALLLNGEYESKSVFKHTEVAMELLPNSESDIIPGAGHASNAEKPDYFNKIVSDFLKKHKIK
jgi:pimeloyl-ACP methyl ester carboxylesterase